MADPGKLNYVLDGQPLYFINENDNKLIIRSDAPEATVSDTGVVRPSVGSLTAAGQAPKLSGIAWPTTAGVALSGKQPNIVGSNENVAPTTASVDFSGQTPTLNVTVSPSTSSLTITGYIGARWTGLWFEGIAPTTVVAEVELPTVGALSFASDVIDAYRDNERVPPKKSVVLAGQAPTVNVGNTVLPTTASVDITGRLPTTFKVAYPARRSLSITGYAPTVARSEGQVTVIIEGPFEYGTFIRNPWATTDVPVNYQIDDRTGFKIKVKHPMVQEYTGHMMRPESVDKRSEQEFLRAKPEHHKGPLRPEPVGDEKFIEDEFPNGVSADDL